MPIFAVTIFTAAFLLFQVQPIIAKYILPSNPTRYGIEPWAMDKLGLERIAARAASNGRIDPVLRHHLLTGARV